MIFPDLNFTSPGDTLHPKIKVVSTFKLQVQGFCPGYLRGGYGEGGGGVLMGQGSFEYVSHYLSEHYTCKGKEGGGAAPGGRGGESLLGIENSQKAATTLSQK